MLVLSRKLGEKLCIDTDIVVTVLKVDRFGVHLGIDAPAQVPVRQEDGPCTTTDGRFVAPAACAARPMAGSTAARNSR